MKYSKKEIIDITKAWAAISIAFAIILRNSTGNFILSLVLSALTVGIGFLLHELGHKFLAQKYGNFAEFRSFDNMLLLAIALSFFGFVFAAPGAVFITGYVNRERNGKISAIGPAINIGLAIIFLIVKFSFSGFIGLIGTYGLMINAWLALFNMIPVWNFDGKKVWAWNKGVWLSIALVSFILLFF